MEFSKIETRRTGAIFACFRVVQVCQHQLGFVRPNSPKLGSRGPSFVFFRNHPSSSINT